VKGYLGLPYRIEYAPETKGHLAALTARQRALVLDAVDEQLRHQPTEETRNRKRMRPNPLGDWELRVQNLRVYYNVLDDPGPVVRICAIGTKAGNQVYLGGEPWEGS
jgi:mRNA interferase RelE/StbE